MKKPEKKFYTYEQQISHLKNKGLIIDNEDIALFSLKRYSYYALISGYKSIFKVEKNGPYRSGIKFSDILRLYQFDDELRRIFLRYILQIEKYLKSLYSYYFCDLFGDKMQDYLDVNNYNYERFQKDVNDFVNIISQRLKKCEDYNYISYNMKIYNSVPLWVLIHSLTFGNISKMYSFSKQKLQSKISSNFDGVMSFQLNSLIRVLSYFRNVCAHNERLYNYKTTNVIKDMPVHNLLGIPKVGQEYKYGKRDLFSVVICFKYLLEPHELNLFIDVLLELFRTYEASYDKMYFDFSDVLREMGFYPGWEEIGRIPNYHQIHQI